MNEEEKILTIRVRNLCKAVGAERLSFHVCGVIEYAMEHGGTDTILGLPLICTGSSCIDGTTCKNCWEKQFNKLQEGGDPLL